MKLLLARTGFIKSFYLLCAIAIFLCITDRVNYPLKINWSVVFSKILARNKDGVIIKQDEKKKQILGFCFFFFL